ncbi:MAG: hypothetical protein LUQ71_07670 [Methanoregula sp.]|nr:hypothetical protein [Methanoregula sp.]
MKGTRIAIIAVTAICLLLCVQIAGATSIQLNPPAVSGSQAAVSQASVSVAAASANDNYPISEKQAKDNIRVFMGDLTLEPVLTTTGSLPIGNYYYFTEGNSTFTVNQNTGIVEFAHFGDNAPGSTDIVLTRDDAYTKATGYANGKVTDFSSRTWKLVVDRVDEQWEYVYNQTSNNWEEVVTQKAYDFVFREKKDNVLLPSLVYISVNPKTGSIVDYWGVDRLNTVSSLKNTVSRSDAVKTAENYWDDADYYQSEESHLEVVIREQNVENLAWVISLTHTYSDDDTYTYVFVVDANDGSVLGTHWDNIWPLHWLRYYI